MNKERKFKVGDKVRVIATSGQLNEVGLWNIERHSGKERIIMKDVSMEYGDDDYPVYETDDNFWYPENYLQKIS